MGLKNTPFHERVAALETQGNLRNRKGAKVLYEKRPDGLLVPVTTPDSSNRFPWKALTLALVMTMGVKTGLYTAYGEDQVMARAEAWAAQKPAANAALVLLQPEPVTNWLITQTKDVLGAVQ